MKRRQLIYSSAVVFVGMLQLAPCALLFGGSVVPVLFGVSWLLLLFYAWSYTVAGRWFVREWYASTLRIEKELLGSNS